MLALLALASSGAWGAADFGAGVLTRRIPSWAVVMWSQGGGLLAVTLVLVFHGGFHWGPWGPYAIAAGAVGSLALVCFYAALATGTMGVVAPIASLGVILPVVVGILRGDSAGPLAWVGVAVAVIGVVLASGPELSGEVGPRPVILAALAAVGFGGVLVLVDLGARVSVLPTLWGMRVTSVAGFSLAALLMRRTGGVGGRDLPLLALVGVGDVLANGLYAVAASRGLVSLASVLGSLYPVVTIILARFVLGERLRRVQAVGVVLTVLGALAVAS